MIHNKTLLAETISICVNKRELSTDKETQKMSERFVTSSQKPSNHLPSCLSKNFCNSKLKWKNNRNSLRM